MSDCVVLVINISSGLAVKHVPLGAKGWITGSIMWKNPVKRSKLFQGLISWLTTPAISTELILKKTGLQISLSDPLGAFRIHLSILVPCEWWRSKFEQPLSKITALEINTNTFVCYLCFMIIYHETNYINLYLSIWRWCPSAVWFGLLLFKLPDVNYIVIK